MPTRSMLFSLFAIYGARPVLAQLKPTTPGPNETYTAGSSCSIAWVPDTSGSWTNVTIDLMSGANNNMSLVKNVASALDGTDKSLTPFSWTCPEVDPYSAIYFYQFTNGDDTSTRTWTTRFTIASPSNDTEPPVNSQQPNGEDVPWGIGHLKDSKSTSSLNTDNESNSDSPQSTFALPLASASASATPSHGKKLHGHNSDSGNNDGDDEHEGDDNEDQNGGSTKDSASKTHSANVAGAKSAAARATAMAHTHDASSASNDSNSDESGEADSDNSDNSDTQSTSNSVDSDQAHSSISDSNPSYKNSGAADAADSSNAVGCHCAYENGVGSRLLASGFVSSIVVSVLSALVATYL